MRKLAVGIAIGASAFLATQALVWFGAFNDVELTAYDRRLVATHTPADALDDIVIIEINESSMDTMEPAVVLDGSVVVTVGADRREVAVIEAEGYFGEMSLLTGDQRTASVTARQDTTVLEIPAEAFATYVRGNPSVLEAIAAAATTRRRELEDVKQAPGAAQTPVSASLLSA